MDRQYVGIDFHRRRSVILRKNAAGREVELDAVANDPWGGPLLQECRSASRKLAHSVVRFGHADSVRR